MFFESTIRVFPKPQNPDGSLQRITDYYGSKVFDMQAMRNYLVASDLEAIERIMMQGGRIDSGLAERLAAAVREWASEHGATHFCHWFQPQTGATAEKHEAFFAFDRSGKPIERLTGKELLQGEPDASSFPSGGMRSTFEARGYTSWDPTSPMFLVENENGCTLYIPSVFVGHHGESLDFKVPLLRSLARLSDEATKTLHYLGEKHINSVKVNIGPEQEFFVIEREVAMRRQDLLLTGRSLFGARAPKGQELEDHYFGSIPPRVQAFMQEVELELHKLGVPIRTRHNEVAPCQFELAPIYETANIACDHNYLVMTMLKMVAARHNLMVLLHEKPFAGINGSGKHLNWSLEDSSGRNLFDPGKTPQDNVVFLVFLAAALYGIFKHADVLRASIASAGNDHRLGANEAPPAIMSVFLGETLSRVLDGLENNENIPVSAEKTLIDLGVNHLQNLMRDSTDRNRTSPFAFTGNKFEFRAVGSSAAIGYPVTMLNAAVLSGLKYINERLQAKAVQGVVSPENALEIVREIIKLTKNIRFEGNGYSEEWKQEAAARGLNNFATTPEALNVFNNKEQVAFLIENGIFSESDLEARVAIQYERYIKQRLIEIRAALDIVNTAILPAGFQYLGELAAASKNLGAELASAPLNNAIIKLNQCLGRVETERNVLQLALEKLIDDTALEHENLAKTAQALALTLLPKYENLRAAVDQLELCMPSTLWPLPRYAEILFGWNNG